MAYSVDVLTFRITVTFTISNSCMVRERVRDRVCGRHLHAQTVESGSIRNGYRAIVHNAAV